MIDQRPTWRQVSSDNAGLILTTLWVLVCIVLMLAGYGCTQSGHVAMQDASRQVRDAVTTADTAVQGSESWLDLGDALVGAVGASGPLGLAWYVISGIARRRWEDEITGMERVAETHRKRFRDVVRSIELTKSATPEPGREVITLDAARLRDLQESLGVRDAVTLARNGV